MVMVKRWLQLHRMDLELKTPRPRSDTPALGNECEDDRSSQIRRVQGEEKVRSAYKPMRARQISPFMKTSNHLFWSYASSIVRLCKIRKDAKTVSRQRSVTIHFLYNVQRQRWLQPYDRSFDFSFKDSG